MQNPTNISERDIHEAMDFISALDLAEDAELGPEFLVLFFRNYKRTNNVYLAYKDSLGDLGIA